MAAELDPLNHEYIFNRGMAHLFLEDYSEALADFELHDELYPGYALSYKNQGIIYYRLEEWESVVEFYSLAIEVEPLQGTYYAWRSIAYWKLGNIEQANADEERAHELGVTLHNPFK